MSFRKLGRKLSAVLCSAMMFGGSNISNHLSMAAGLKLNHKLSSIRQFGETKVDGVSVRAFRALFVPNPSKVFEITFSEVEDKVKEQTVKLCFENTMGDDFAISVKNGKEEARFGILPFSYFVYNLQEVGLTFNEVRKFGEMGEGAKKKLLIAILRILNCKDPAREIINNYEKVLEYFRKSLEGIKPDVDKDGDEDEFFRISNACIAAFRKADPMVGEQPLFGENGEEIAVEEEEEKEEEKENLSEKKNVPNPNGSNPKSSNVLRNSLIVGGSALTLGTLGAGIGVPVYKSRRAKSLVVNRNVNANKGELTKSKEKRINNLNISESRKSAANNRRGIINGQKGRSRRLKNNVSNEKVKLPN